MRWVTICSLRVMLSTAVIIVVGEHVVSLISDTYREFERFLECQ